MAARSDSSDREIVITRVFDAPRELVWEAWTRPEHVANWWGPRGFTTTVTELDLRPGGRSRYVMRGPDGAEYPVKGVFREVVPPERIVTTDEFEEGYDYGGADLPQGIILTCLFEDLGGKTRLTLRIMHRSAEDRRKHEEMGVVAGWNSTFDCLDEHLAATAAGATPDREVVTVRVFDAPRDRVWEAWTRPEHVRRWYGLRTLTVTGCDIDLRPGGRYRYVLRAADGAEHAFSGEYREVSPPARLVYTWGYEAIPGAEAVETVTFDEHAGKTAVTMRTLFPSAAHLDGWAKSGGREGLAETLDRLGELVAKK